MTVILVDYENVSVNGLRGVDLLYEEDVLDIFYSDDRLTIRKDALDSIVGTKCVFRTIKLLNKGKDYLDKYIATAAGEWYRSGADEIAIISKDKGFQAVIDYYKVAGTKDLIIIRDETVEMALARLSNSAGHTRRSIIAERSKPISLDEVGFRLKERAAIRDKVRNALVNTPYRFRIKAVCDLVTENKDSKKSIYTGALHSFGREEGRELYNMIREVI